MPPSSPGPLSPFTLNPNLLHILQTLTIQMNIPPDKDRILLPHSPRDPFTGSPSRSHRRNPEVDFLDVFGGPPRRSSVYESRRSSSESCSGPSRGREDLVGSRRSRLGSGEKPVFGDGSGSSRRQQLGDDFFGDIFQISESGCSSPRKADSDSLMSCSSSSVSSPVRPAMTGREPMFGGGSSVLLPSSLSETMAKGSNHPVFHSPSSPNVSSTGPFTTQSVKDHGDPRNNDYDSYRQAPLSHQISYGLEGFSESENMEPALKSQTGKSSTSLEDYINNRQFHFSIYKWAGKGVMLVMPSDSNEKNEFEGKLARFPEVLIQELELPTHYDYLSSLTKPLKSGTAIEEDKSDKRDDDYAEITAKISEVASGLELLKSDANITYGKYGNESEKTSLPAFEKNSSTNSTDGEQSSQSSINLHCEQNLEQKNVSQMLDDDDISQQRNSDISRKDKENEVPSKSPKKQQALKESKLVPGEINSMSFHDMRSFSEDKPLNKVRGKVKEFIKKFNHEALPKRKGALEIPNPRCKGTNNKHDKTEELAHSFSTEPDKLQENQVIQKAEVEKSSIYPEVHTINDRPSEERAEVLDQQSELSPEDHKNAEFYEETIQEDFEEYLVQQLPLNHAEEVQSNSEQDQIKISDANIRQWSKGKEGNIRSLLSTLQLVLWPESGWKQVPLVNIIEAPSVKKAYQKALLCLHPDKLQQKGASLNQKYIAEKVFDILQEAWDHFNSVSQF